MYLSQVRPWRKRTAVRDGLLERQATEDDPTYLAVSFGSGDLATGDAWLENLLGAVPDRPPEGLLVGDVQWSLYAAPFAAERTVLDVGITETPGALHAILMQSQIQDRPNLYFPVFTEAVRGFVPAGGW